MLNFKVGDKVKCIEGCDYLKLYKDHVYTISAVKEVNNFPDMVDLAELPEHKNGAWFEYRFVKMLPSESSDLRDDIVKLQNENDMLKRYLIEAAKDLNNADRKIFAIKSYRAATGKGLKESKDVVESWNIIPVPPRVIFNDQRDARIQRLEDRVQILESNVYAND
jgi:hypothetical protein